jgi:hypothetical protein
MASIQPGGFLPAEVHHERDVAEGRSGETTRGNPGTAPQADPYQADGWRLEQPEPGILVWHTPAGRTYTTTTPTQYAA